MEQVNFTEVNVMLNVSSNVSAALPTVSTFQNIKPAFSLEALSTVALAVGIIGSFANAVVITVLILAGPKSGSNVNKLIVNQCAMDLLACASLVGNHVAMHYFASYGNSQTVDDVICMFVEGGIASFAVSAGKFGLVIITLERYFKIVHAVAHRKYYRKWMTSVGIALPWISGVCFIVFPTIGTTRVVNGQCFRLGVWPNKGMAKAFSVAYFIWHYPLPVGVFTYCYGRIFLTIRRQSKVVTCHVGRSQDVAMATTSRDQNRGQIQQQAASGAKLSRTELNIIQTMITVIASFMVFSSAGSILNFLILVGVYIPRYVFFLVGSLGFLNQVVNPIIYAARYEAFKRYVKEKLGMNVTITTSSNQAPN